MVSKSDRRASNEADLEAYGLEELVRTRTLRASDVSSMHYCSLLENQFSALEKAAFAWSKSISQAEEETEGGFVMYRGVPERRRSGVESSRVGQGVPGTRGGQMHVNRSPTRLNIDRDSPFYEPASPGDSPSYGSPHNHLARSEDGDSVEGGRAEGVVSETGEHDSTWEEDSGLVEQSGSLEEQSGIGERSEMDAAPATEDEDGEGFRDSDEGTSDDEELPPSENATTDDDLPPTEELEASYTTSDEDESSHSTQYTSNERSLERRVNTHDTPLERQDGDPEHRVYDDEASSDASHLSSEKENQLYPEEAVERRHSTDTEPTENPLFRASSDDSDASDARGIEPRERRQSGLVFQRRTGSGQRMSSSRSPDVVVVSSLAHAKKVRRRFVESPVPPSVSSHAKGKAVGPTKSTRAALAQEEDDEVLREITDIANGTNRMVSETHRPLRIAAGGSGLIAGVFADTSAMPRNANRHKKGRSDRKASVSDDDARQTRNNTHDAGLIERVGVLTDEAEAENVYHTEIVTDLASVPSRIRKAADMVTPDRATEEPRSKKQKSVAPVAENQRRTFRFELERESLFDKYALLTGLSAEQLQDLYAACNEPEDTTVLDQVLHFLLYKVRNPPDSLTEIDQRLGEFFRAHVWFPFEDHLLLNNLHSKKIERAKGLEAMKERIEYLRTLYSSADAYSLDQALEKWPFSEFSIQQILYYKRK